jgi:heavy metal sensor kinase
MKAMSIRARLTTWYFLILGAALSGFAILALAVMRQSIYTTVDEQLDDRMHALQSLIARSEAGTDVEAALRERAELQWGSQLFQVSDSSGRFLYRSPAMKRLGVAAAATEQKRISDAEYNDLPLRILTAAASSGARTVTIQVAEPMDDYLEAIERFRNSMLVGIPVLLLVATAGGYWLSRNALRPVDRVTRAAQTITPQDLSQRVAVPQTGDELQRLAETLNQMLQRIESAVSRISQFTADASHELRTPATLIRTRAEVTLANPRTNNQYREALQDVLGESERMSALIENLMILARADTGTETLNFRDIDVSMLASEVCSQAQTLAESKQIRWQATFPQTPIWVHGDANALRRLFLILIDNAVKYTSPGGCIGITFIATGGQVEVRVQDTGIGIPESDLPHVFERFYRSDKARSRELGGTGLGLSIGRWIAKAHGGQIGVESSPAGSVFLVCIPLAPASVSSA